MKTGNFIIFSTSPPAPTARNFSGIALHRYGCRLLNRGIQRKPAVKELDSETGLYYYGARYLDPKTSRWLSGDPAMGEYIPQAGGGSGRLPGMGGVFNAVNLHVYHYAGNNPVKYRDPNGKMSEDKITEDAAKNLTENPQEPIPEEVQKHLAEKGWNVTTESDRADINNELRKFADADNHDWSVSSERNEETVQYEIPLTESEQRANEWRDFYRRNGYPDRNPTGPARPRTVKRNYPNGRIFTVRVRDPETGTIFHIRKEYIDINGDGHVDGWREAK